MVAVQDKPSAIDLFCGAGGLSEGFEREGYEVVWANEINPWVAATFKKNFPNAKVETKSIEELDPYTDPSIPNADLILGGFPCQDFSIIWKRPGLNGERGNLYKHFKRFVDAKKPAAFVAENVKGLLSANNRRAIRAIIRDFQNIKPGYFVKLQLYNFAEYGVPQFRERVIIVGVRMDTGFEFKHPQPTHGPGRKPYFTAGKALKGVKKVPHNNEHMKIHPRTRKILEMISEGGNFQDIPKDHPLYVNGMISHVYRRINRNEPAKTLIAAGGGGTWGYHYPEPRPLTNRERARLQTFPDNFKFNGPTAEVRRQIGNAVPPLAARIIARELKPLFLKQFAPVDLNQIVKKINGMPIEERLKLDMFAEISPKQPAVSQFR
jgi:DNA (cytosine-5)-methyltransferase 1